MPSLPPELKSSTAFYAHLGVKKAEQDFLSKHADYRYRALPIAKRSGGVRILLIPERRLKYLQRKTLNLLEQIYSGRAPVHGFVKERGILTNADLHQKRPYILNLDLRNFFGAISRRRVYGMLRAMRLEDEVASAICNISISRNQLPQGAPTSPILSNLVAHRLDRDLMSFAKTNGLHYTRYADDLTFSSRAQPAALFEGGLPLLSGRVAIEQLSPNLVMAIRSNGFDLNNEKIWFAGRKARKEVTGLVVNEFVNVRRTFVRDLRAALYKTEKLGVAAAEADYRAQYKTKAPLIHVLRGRLEWLAQVRGRSFTAYRTLAKRYNTLFPGSAVQIDPTYREIIERSVWVVEYAVDVTNSDGKQEVKVNQGTAFFLEGVGLVTCHHVLADLPAGETAELVRPSDGKSFKAKMSGQQCENRDLAILEHDVPDDAHLNLAVTTSPANAKDDIVALGFPALNRAGFAGGSKP